MALPSQGVFIKRAGTEIGALTGFTGPEAQSNFTDTTHLRSVAKEYIPGLKDNGSLSFTGFWLPTDPAQVAMRADQNALASAVYTITLTDSPPSVGTFTAFVEQMSMAVAPDGAIGLNGSLRITGDVVWA
jgi:hypothetical protein